MYPKSKEEKFEIVVKLKNDKDKLNPIPTKIKVEITVKKPKKVPEKPEPK